MTLLAKKPALPAALAVAVTLAGLGASLPGCDAYAPDLGYEPFRCGTAQPYCPIDYSCVEFTDGQRICQKTGADAPDAGDDSGDDAGGGEVTCNDDADVEPNNVVAQAYPTGIPDDTNSFSLAGLAICPSSDIDLFELDVLVQGTHLEAEIEYRPGFGQLTLDVLDRNSEVIGSAEPVPGSPDTLHVEVDGVPLGSVYVRVRGGGGVENNYDSISITTTP